VRHLRECLSVCVYVCVRARAHVHRWVGARIIVCGSGLGPRHIHSTHSSVTFVFVCAFESHPFPLLLPDQGVEDRAQGRLRGRCSC
jgi:hypothetical protein